MVVQHSIKTVNIFLTYGRKCTWSFFATSHCKSPCDGLGCTIKRLAARASLQRPIDNQILSAIEMFKFCEKEIDGITCIYVYQV